MQVSRPSPVLAVAGLVLLSLLAGCAGREESTGEAVRPSASFSEDTGAIEGLVVNDVFEPIEGADVGIRREGAPSNEFAAQTRTDAGGRFALGDVEPGPYHVLVQALGYKDASRKADVVAGRATDVGEIKLLEIASIDPFSMVQAQRGVFGCGVSWAYPPTPQPVPRVTGIAICGVLGTVDEVVGTNTSGYDKFLLLWPYVDVPVEAWNASVFEMRWTSNQVLGRGLTMLFETEECFNQGEKCRFANATGPSPLRFYSNGTRMQKTLDAASACEESNCTIMSRVFSAAETLGAGSPLDAGVTFQQPYEIYISAFFYEPAPVDWTALA